MNEDARVAREKLVNANRRGTVLGGYSTRIAERSQGPQSDRERRPTPSYLQEASDHESVRGLFLDLTKKSLACGAIVKFSCLGLHRWWVHGIGPGVRQSDVVRRVGVLTEAAERIGFVREVGPTVPERVCQVKAVSIGVTA